MRADPSVFDLPVEKIRSGYYSDAYFNRTKELLEADRHFPNVTMQVFQKRDAVLGGIDEAIAVLKRCSGKTYRAPDMLNPGQTWDAWVDGWDRLEVYALDEADFISPREPVMHIVGPYHLFAHLETVYLGILARRTMIATNVRRVLDAANNKPIFYFPARHDHWQVQTGDGYTAHKAGVEGVSTDAQANWWGGKGMGTVPHALIAAYGGDTVKAAQAYAKRFAGQTNISVLVDFENDSVGTSLKVADALGYNLWGVRLDTSETLVDRSLWPEMGSFKPTGVNPRLVETVRAQLDAAGYHWVRIIASGGFTADKIKSFEDADVPVDAYGVGASLIHGDNAYTADIVRVDGKPCAKVGREYIANSRLELVT
jgi:nicotinate phosphoribosyltransferase